MTQRNWRGTTLFLSILTVLGATLGLKFYSVAELPAATTSLSTGSTGSSPAAPTPAAPTPAAPTPSAPTPSAAAPTAPAVATIEGDSVGTPYGNVQVQVSFSGSKITRIKVLQVPRESGRDAEIADYSVPILNREVLDSQSAQVDSVSGATYTSEGYLQSVQSAIDKRG
jgi:uncharacterized protein with FMN-binding domain